MTGYTVATTTYTGTAEAVTCALGYTGTPDPASATCGTDGSWSDSAFTGCQPLGIYPVWHMPCLLLHYFWFYNNNGLPMAICRPQIGFQHLIIRKP